MLFGVPYEQLAILAVGLLAAGAVTGILAGVFGVGGGAVIVPVLYELFGVVGVPAELRMPLAVGTSLAIIIPTSIRSFQAHRAKGAVDMDILRAWAVPVIVGVIAGSLVARYAPPGVFKAVFVFVAGLSAWRLITGKELNFGTGMPGPAGMVASGGVIGVLSSLMGIGGGQLGNLVMMAYGRTIHNAVATSSGLAEGGRISGRRRHAVSLCARLCLTDRVPPVHPDLDVDGPARRAARPRHAEADA
jgi:uncharacterized membrane protein YfcA